MGYRTPYLSDPVKKNYPVGTLGQILVGTAEWALFNGDYIKEKNLILESSSPQVPPGTFHTSSNWKLRKRFSDSLYQIVVGVKTIF